ncbi:MAG TPA: sugar ABC transporter substrate-binding protein [Solirubrobacterales bacterium]|nr:sugar ABC transporter substrate-binding protein [Solirubrobacterales bacterium]
MSAAVITSILVLGTAGCGGSSDDSDGKPNIAVVIPNPGNPYWGDVLEGAESAAEASKDANVSFTTSTREDPTELLLKIENALASQPDALAVVPQYPEELESIIARTIEGGTPVVMIDTPVENVDASFVGTDNVKGGRVAGEYVAENLKSGGTAAIIHCVPGITTSDERVEGFEETLEGTGIEIVAVLDGKCELEKGREKMENILTAHPDLGAVFSVSDSQTLGALQAVDESNRPIIVSYDAQEEMLEALGEGKLDGDVAQFPVKMGEQGVELAIEAALGKEIPATTDTGVELVTKENLASFSGN